LPVGVQVVLADVTLADNRMRFNSRGVAPDLVGEASVPLANLTGRKDVRINRLGSLRTQ
jgi:hypothetical protein